MTEAVSAVLLWGFEALTELDRVVTAAVSANTGSRRVLEKCGFELTGLVPEMWEKFDDPVELAAYVLHRDRWRQLRAESEA